MHGLDALLIFLQKIVFDVDSFITAYRHYVEHPIYPDKYFVVLSVKLSTRHLSNYQTLVIWGMDGVRIYGYKAGVLVF